MKRIAVDFGGTFTDSVHIHVDAAGLLSVVPESAGADPGPMAYRPGRTEPTVTDIKSV